MKFQWRLSLYTILLSIILAGCAPSSTIKQSTLSPQEQLQNTLTRLLTKADKAKPQEASRLRAEAVQLLRNNGDTSQYVSILNDITIGLLPAEQQFEFSLLKAKTAFDKGDYLTTINHIDTALNSQPKPISQAQSIQLLGLKAEAQIASAQTFPAIKTLIDISLLQDNESRATTHNLIWSQLTTIEPNHLRSKLQSGANNYYEQGWLELVNELNNNKQLDTQYEAYRNWQALWQSHPAYLLPPNAIQGLTNQTLTASKLAILLPFEGKLSKAAEAIKAGILIAHFRSQTSNTPGPELLFLDSTKINTAAQLEAITQEENVDLIIGPLNKDYVSALVSSPILSTPVLALNYSDNLNREGIVQFGLSTDDEAEQLAERLFQDGKKRALVLTPNTKWGTKISEHFTKHFASLGGQTNNSVLYGDTAMFSDDVSSLLNTNASKARYKALRSTLYTKKIEFEEYRRTDVDAIVLAALPNDARQLTPILAFNFAGNLPIYASSHVYSGSSDSIADEDLNRIKFIGTPWNLAPPSQNKVLLSQQKSDINSRIGRLYALGIDAYRLHPYLKQLAAVPGTEISGETGALSLDQNGHIKRKLMWAEYMDGTPQVIE